MRGSSARGRGLGPTNPRGLQVRLQGGPSARETPCLRRGGREADLLSFRVEGTPLLDAAHGDAAGPRARGDRLLTLEQGVIQVNGDEVSEGGDRDLSEFVCSASHVQGGADAEAGLPEQLQAPSCRDGESAHACLSDRQREVLDQLVGLIRVRGFRNTCRTGEVARCRPCPAHIGSETGARPRNESGALGRDADALRWGSGNGGAELRRSARKKRLDDDTLKGIGYRPSQEYGSPTVGEGHLDGSLVPRGDQKRSHLLHEGPITGVHPAVRREAQIVQARPQEGAGQPRTLFGLQICLQQGPLPLRALLQQTPFDSEGCFAHQGGYRRIHLVMRTGVVEDADDAPAERVLYRNGQTGIHVQAFSKMLVPENSAGASFHQSDPDAVGTDVSFGDTEASGDVVCFEAFGQLRFAGPAPEYQALPIREGHACPGARNPGPQPVKHGLGRTHKLSVQVKIPLVGRLQMTCRETKRLAALP